LAQCATTLNQTQIKHAFSVITWYTYISKWSFSLKEMFQIHSKIQKIVKFLYFNLFGTVSIDSESVSNETNFLSYFELYTRKWSFSLNDTFQIHSIIQKNVKFFYFYQFGSVCSDFESVLQTFPYVLECKNLLFFVWQYILETCPLK